MDKESTLSNLGPLTLLGTKDEIVQKMLKSKEPDEIELLFTSLVNYKHIVFNQSFLEIDKVIPSERWHSDYFIIYKLCLIKATPKKVKEYIFRKVYCLKKQITLDKKNSDTIKRAHKLLNILFRENSFSPLRLKIFWHYGVKKYDKRINYAIHDLLWNNFVSPEDREKLEKKVTKQKTPPSLVKLILLSKTTNQSWLNQEYEQELASPSVVSFDLKSNAYCITHAILNNYNLSTSEMLETVYEKIIAPLIKDTSNYYKNEREIKRLLKRVFNHPKSSEQLLKLAGQTYFTYRAN